MRRPRDLTGKPLGKWSCSHCKDGECNKCVDIMRLVMRMEPVCECRRPGHDGEPLRKQIKDPETGTVYAPGLSVSSEGEVKRS